MDLAAHIAHQHALAAPATGLSLPKAPARPHAGSRGDSTLTRSVAEAAHPQAVESLKTQAWSSSTNLVDVSSTEQQEVRSKAARAALDLKQNGWACVEDVLPREVCEEYQNGFWDWIEALGTGVKRDDPSTWQHPYWPTSYRGIINSFEVAHQAFVWRIRKHSKVRQIFEELWGSSALLSSFDSINALPPQSKIDKQAWLHVDQAPYRKGACCIQGLVNLVDVSPETTGTLLVKTGTHKEHENFFSSSSVTPVDELRQTGDHYKFKAAELPYWDSYNSVGVTGKAGSLFLWDSRAVHANVFPDETTDFRHVVYTCYQPASMASDSEMAEKKRIYENYLISTHWPAMNVAAHGNGEDYFGSGEKGVQKDLTEYRTRDAVEDDSLRKLAGVLPYNAEEVYQRKAMVDMTENELRAIAEGC